ncbi:hypothetical protein EJD97_017538 [Solanum chilense]|uniref:Uncharacterized protein n=1 Tax=Solanum chilense TaxID=4083 RepID=A0A6N2B6V7_SOLCI|nr:hypothetical protein EJD97_017538 [Solanum chilense]
MVPVKRKIDTSDTTKIKKKARRKIDRKKNGNTTLLEDLATETVFSSQFSLKVYEEREVVEEEEEKQKEIEEKQGKAIKPNANDDSIIRYVLRKPFIKFRVKMELVGAITIKRDRVVNTVVNELVVFDDVDGVGAGAGVVVGAGVGVGAGQD